MMCEFKMTQEVIKAQIDVCGQSVAYVAKNVRGAVSDEVMWSLNQAIISLEDAYNLVYSSTELYPANRGNRYVGWSVRLVRE